MSTKLIPTETILNENNILFLVRAFYIYTVRVSDAGFVGKALH